MLRIPVGRLRVLADEHRREAPRPPHVLRHGGIGDTEVVEGHVPFAEMVPLHGLVEVPELVVNGGSEHLLVVVVTSAMLDAVIADAGDGVPVAKMKVEHVVVGADGVKQAEVVELLIEIVHILGLQGGPSPFEILAREQAARLLHQGDQLPFHQRPGRRGRNARGSDPDHGRQIDLSSGHRSISPVCVGICSRAGHQPPPGSTLSIPSPSGRSMSR